jgi:hypothetical protein
MTEPADWGRRFQELTADAGQLYARSLRRYDELLRRVAGGELKPEGVQKQFGEYLQEQAGTSTRELVELSVGLLAGLLHIEAKYREAMLDGLLPSEGPVPPPPSPSSIDLTNWFQTLSKYAAEQSSRGVARHQQLVERVASGEITPAQMQEQNRRYLEAQAPQFVGEVMDLGLSFVGRLQQSSTNLTDGLYDRVLGPEVDESSAAPGPPLVVDLRGASGSVITKEIVVENTRSAAADVVCRVSEFTPRAGGESFGTDVEVVPSRFTLAPGEARDVTLSLPLDRHAFAPGVDYFAILRISGAGEREMMVQLIAHSEKEAKAAAARRAR